MTYADYLQGARAALYLVIGLLIFRSYGTGDMLSRTRRKIEGIWFMVLAAAVLIYILRFDWMVYYQTLLLTPFTLALLAVELLALIANHKWRGSGNPFQRVSDHLENKR